LRGLRDGSIEFAARKHGIDDNSLHYASYEAAVNWLRLQSRLMVGYGG
jgi:hypothetical protein